jgi:hypothetical protein
MWRDEIVEETRKTRHEYASEFDYDLEAIYEDLKQKEAETKHKVVSLMPREPERIPRAKAS